MVWVCLIIVDLRGLLVLALWCEFVSSLKTYVAFLFLLYGVSLSHHWRLTWPSCACSMVWVCLIIEDLRGLLVLALWCEFVSSLKTYVAFLCLLYGVSLYHHWRLTWPSCACSMVWVCIIIKDLRGLLVLALWCEFVSSLKTIQWPIIV
jgi:hypothetical protein